MSTLDRSVKVPYIARIEGEGALDIEVKEGKVEKVLLDIYEPPRFFQGSWLVASTTRWLR
ncbi:MAG: hypothetical protein ACOX3V_04910 [Bacillota bacterium]|jgi:sulfhydrogenase subunit alpha